MTTVNEVTVTGRKFRKLVDEATKLWQRISFWTKASDVEFDDGMTAEMKMGAVDGITDSLASTSSKIAASAKALKQVNDKLAQGRLEFIVNDDGSIWYRLDGADTVFPFSRNYISIDEYKTSMQPTHYNIGFRPKLVVCGADISAQLCWYNAETNKCYYGSDSKHGVDLGVSLYNTYRFDSIDDMGFTFSVIQSTYNNQDMIIFALG